MKLRCLSVIFLFLLGMVFVSCRTSREIPKDCTNYIFENQSDYRSYFIRLDYIDGTYAEGRAYSIDDDLLMEADAFTVNVRKNKCKVTLCDTIVYTLKLKSYADGIYGGGFTGDNISGKKSFMLYPYHDDDPRVFDRKRYQDEIFEVEKISDVTYANVEGFWSSLPDDTIDVVNIIKMGVLNSLKKKDLDLDMDIYLPKNDTLEKRPLMMFIHGGAFFTGDKATLPYQKWCTHFASLGYVCVSINYRMGFRISSKSIERTAYQATQDAHAAMRYLVSKKDVYRIDPDYLFVGGASAGSITALNLAYMRNKNRPESSYSGFLRSDLGGLETSGNRIYSKFKIKAVANMCGSVYDLEILKNSKASIISFHGDEDGILPYEYGYPFEILGDFKEVLFNEMYGSLMIHEKALELGIRSELHTFRGQGHSLHLDENRNLSDNFYVMQDEMVDFFYDELLPSPVRILQDENDIHRFTVDMTDVEVLDWNVVGGVVIEENEGEIRASWLEDENVRELRVSGYYTNGACFEDVFVIENAEVYESNSY